MEGEVESMMKVSLMVSFSMAYARFASSRINPGNLRLLALLPVISLLPYLPFLFSTINLRGTSAFFLAWLALFKLLLLSFGLGPLSPSLPLLPFIATASLPVKLKKAQPADPDRPTTTTRRLLLNSAGKALLLAAVIPLYTVFTLDSHPYLLLAFYCALIYLSLELNLTAAATIAAALNLSLEPQFNAPLRSTSLQDFWGRRWNLMVTNILRPSVYVPVSTRYGKAAGVMATFLVSGLMHEIMFYYLTLSRPTGEVTMFFLIHGVCVVVEGMGRRGGWWPRPAVAIPASVGLLVVTLVWLFFPPLIRTGYDERAMQELMAVLGWVEDALRRLGYWLGSLRLHRR